MKWLNELLFDLGNEFREILRQLRKGETWFTLGLIAAFGLIAYLIAQFAFRTDSVLLYLHRTVGYCREMTNGTIIFMFCGMIFFMLAAVVTLGEFQRYFDFRRRNAHYQARQALLMAVVWSLVAIAISAASLLFFKYYCR